MKAAHATHAAHPVQEWEDAQAMEASWWGDCTNTYGEETKQRVYARAMGIPEVPHGPGGFAYDLKGQTVVDIGGGPCSLLLRSVNLGVDKKTRYSKAVVIDPCAYPTWVAHRYMMGGISLRRVRGEAPIIGRYDLALIYNCLQHVEDPERIIANARKASKELKMFEWIDIPPHDGHPHMLTAASLQKWTGEQGNVGHFNGDDESGCVGKAWYCW